MLCYFLHHIVFYYFHPISEHLFPTVNLCSAAEEAVSLSGLVGWTQSSDSPFKGTGPHFFTFLPGDRWEDAALAIFLCYIYLYKFFIVIVVIIFFFIVVVLFFFFFFYCIGGCVAPSSETKKTPSEVVQLIGTVVYVTSGRSRVNRTCDVVPVCYR